MVTASNGPVAVVGLGMTQMTRRYVKSSTALAVEAVQLALDDVGLVKEDLDGLLTHPGMRPDAAWAEPHVSLGLRNLRLHSNAPNHSNSPPGFNMALAARAIRTGAANTVCYVFSDAPLTPDKAAGSGAALYGRIRPRDGGGSGHWGTLDGLTGAYGFFGANTRYALAARRHMALYSTTNDHFGAVAVSNRKWAGLNPLAVYRDPMTLEDYHNSRWIVEPFHLFDCCMVNNGAIAIITTSAERARDLKQPPAYILGMGEGFPGNPRRRGFENEVNTGAQIAKETAYPMAGIEAKDIDAVQTYDNYTYTSIVTLEDYGFCAKGEGGPFVSDGKIEPGGSLPINTYGGLISGHYLWGASPISEGIIQARGQGGERQLPKHDVVLSVSQGGLLDYHYCFIFSPHPSLH